MGLNKSKGNMYNFVTHTWNTIKGKCYHDCSYCYMKRWGKQKPIRLDEKEFKTDLGKANFIFVGSSCDMFAEDIQKDWIVETLKHCDRYDNKYLFQSKNPKRFTAYIVDSVIYNKSIFCVTIETNRFYSEMGNTIDTYQRAEYLKTIGKHINTYITIEPIFDFDLYPFFNYLKLANPIQINIGADSGNNNLPEPPKEKILDLIKELEKFTKVKLKKNLNRLLEKNKDCK